MRQFNKRVNSASGPTPAPVPGHHASTAKKAAVPREDNRNVVLDVTDLSKILIQSGTPLDFNFSNRLSWMMNCLNADQRKNLTREDLKAVLLDHHFVSPEKAAMIVDEMIAALKDKKIEHLKKAFEHLDEAPRVISVHFKQKEIATKAFENYFGAYEKNGSSGLLTKKQEFYAAKRAHLAVDEFLNAVGPHDALRNPALAQTQMVQDLLKALAPKKMTDFAPSQREALEKMRDELLLKIDSLNNEIIQLANDEFYADPLGLSKPPLWDPPFTKLPDGKTREAWLANSKGETGLFYLKQAVEIARQKNDSAALKDFSHIAFEQNLFEQAKKSEGAKAVENFYSSGKADMSGLVPDGDAKTAQLESDLFRAFPDLKKRLSSQYQTEIEKSNLTNTEKQVLMQRHKQLLKDYVRLIKNFSSSGKLSWKDYCLLSGADPKTDAFAAKNFIASALLFSDTKFIGTDDVDLHRKIPATGVEHLSDEEAIAIANSDDFNVTRDDINVAMAMNYQATAMKAELLGLDSVNQMSRHHEKISIDFKKLAERIKLKTGKTVSLQQLEKALSGILHSKAHEMSFNDLEHLFKMVQDYAQLTAENPRDLSGKAYLQKAKVLEFLAKVALGEMSGVDHETFQFSIEQLGEESKPRSDWSLAQKMRFHVYKELYALHGAGVFLTATHSHLDSKKYILGIDYAKIKDAVVRPPEIQKLFRLFARPNHLLIEDGEMLALLELLRKEHLAKYAHLNNPYHLLDGQKTSPAVKNILLALAPYWKNDPLKNLYVQRPPLSGDSLLPPNKVGLPASSR